MARKRTSVTMPVEEYEKMRQDMKDATATIVALTGVVDWWEQQCKELREDYKEVLDKYNMAVASLRRAERF